MKFVFTVEQMTVFQQTLDVAIKQVGLQGLYTIVELVQVLENPVGPVTQDGPILYEFTEDQIAKFNKVFDIAIKAVGMNGGANIIVLAQILQSPLPETDAEAADLPAETPAE